MNNLLSRNALPVLALVTMVAQSKGETNVGNCLQAQKSIYASNSDVTSASASFTEAFVEEYCALLDLPELGFGNKDVCTIETFDDLENEGVSLNMWANYAPVWNGEFSDPSYQDYVSACEAHDGRMCSMSAKMSVTSQLEFEGMSSIIVGFNNEIWHSPVCTSNVCSEEEANAVSLDRAIQQVTGEATSLRRRRLLSVSSSHDSMRPMPMEIADIVSRYSPRNLGEALDLCAGLDEATQAEVESAGIVGLKCLIEVISFKCNGSEIRSFAAAHPVINSLAYASSAKLAVVAFFLTFATLLPV